MPICTRTSLAVPVTISRVATPTMVCSTQHLTTCLTHANNGGEVCGRGGSWELPITGFCVFFRLLRGPGVYSKSQCDFPSPQLPPFSPLAALNGIMLGPNIPSLPFPSLKIIGLIRLGKFNRAFCD